MRPGFLEAIYGMDCAVCFKKKKKKMPKVNFVNVLLAY